MAVLAALAMALEDMVAAVMESTVPPSLVTAMPSVWPMKSCEEIVLGYLGAEAARLGVVDHARAGYRVVLGADAEGGGYGALGAGEGELDDPAGVAGGGDGVDGREGLGVEGDLGIAARRWAARRYRRLRS